METNINKTKSKKGHNSAKNLQLITNIKLDLYMYLTMVYPSVNFQIKSETNINTLTKTKSKKGHISGKIWRIIINIEFDLSFTMI